MLDVMGTGMLREWLAHSTARLPPLLAGTAMLSLADARARYGVGRYAPRAKAPIVPRHGGRFTLRHLRAAL